MNFLQMFCELLPVFATSGVIHHLLHALFGRIADNCEADELDWEIVANGSGMSTIHG